MLKILLKSFSTRCTVKNKTPLRSIKRCFLSNSYELESEFNARLNNKLLKQVNPSTMYLELDQQYNRYKKLHAIDVDLYVNSIQDDLHTDELEDLLYKLRLTPTTIDMMESTTHAFIRLYLKLNKIQELLNVLDDRLNYGIFPDEYCNNLLMNHFIKRNNYRDAAKIAAIQMLQEDFSNEITKHLSLYSCLKYLQTPSPWHPEPAVESTENVNDDDNDEDEEVKVRVHFLRNPYFDGHFDLRSPNDLIGKTLMTIGRENQEDFVSQSYYLVGLGLMKNTQEAKDFLDKVENGKIKVTKDAVEMFKKYIVLDDVSLVANAEADTDAPAKITEDTQALLSLADRVVGLENEANLFEITESKLKEVVKMLETQEIEKQKQKYIEWDSNRERILQQHVEKLKEEEIFKSIEEKKAELASEEERIFFFENEDRIDLQLEEKYPPKEEVVVKRRNEFDGKRNLGRNVVNKKTKHAVDENYVPPDLHKPYSK